MSYTDGNTTTSLVPSEEEMNIVTQTFDKMRDAVINGSKLAEEVAELRKTVEALRLTTQGLQRDIEYYRERNAALDDALISAKHERDEAKSKEAALRRELEDTEGNLISANSTIDSLRGMLSSQISQKDAVVKERDDALLENMRLEEDLKHSMARNAEYENRVTNQASYIAELQRQLAAIKAVFSPQPVVLTPSQPEPTAVPKYEDQSATVTSGYIGSSYDPTPLPQVDEPVASKPVEDSDPQF